MSSTPSIVELQSALATPSGALVGYADEQLPVVDPSWHVRLVTFGDGALGAEQSVLTRNTSPPGWTGISLAEGFGHAAATAADESNGMLFVLTDTSGAPVGSVAHPGGDPGRAMLATESGFTVLRNPLDPSGGIHGPVSLATLDTAGDVVASRVLLDTSVPVDFFLRVAFPDGSFLLVWVAAAACDGCRAVHAWHLDVAGDPLAPELVLHTFDARSYGTYAVAASSSGVLFAWSEGGPGPITLLAAPFDADGHATGMPQGFAQLPGPNAPTLALAAAPGGDFLAAWIDGPGTNPSNASVESVNADGTPEGQASELAPIEPLSGQRMLVVASPDGAMLLYVNEAGPGIEVFAIPLRCSS